MSKSNRRRAVLAAAIYNVIGIFDPEDAAAEPATWPIDTRLDLQSKYASFDSDDMPVCQETP